MPDWLEPMAATLTEERFVRDGWRFERKFDGIRVLARKQGGRVTLWSRNRLELTASYPAVVEAVARDRKSTRLNSSHCTPSRMPSSA